jgi:hypothetical protein
MFDTVARVDAESLTFVDVLTVAAVEETVVDVGATVPMDANTTAAFAATVVGFNDTYAGNGADVLAADTAELEFES